MKRWALVWGAVLGAGLLVLGTAPAVSAYPELTCQVSVDRQVLDPGDTFTATVEASAVDAKGQPLPSSAFSWKFEWNGVVKHRTGATVTASFKAPEVKRSRKITLTARSSSPAGDCVRHLDVTVRGTQVSAPTGGHGGSGMPNTGGPAFWILVAGLVLVAGGGGAVAASRRRS
jgi:LPXTG-motif cell wall-anchored protein